MKCSHCTLPFFAAASIIALSGCLADTDTDTDSDAAEEEVIDTAEEGVTANAWNFVCATSLTLRDQPGGAVIGTMYNTAYHSNSWFWPVSYSNGWAYGFSYSLNRWGWAMNHYLTTNYAVKGVPDQPGSSWWCQQGNVIVGATN